jgi:hypothetical protein
MRYVAIAGTWGQRDPEAAIDPWRDWWHPQSHWSADMQALGWHPLRPDPFRWSTDLDGTWLQRVVQRRIFGDWWAAAYALCYYCGHEPTVEGPAKAREYADLWVSRPDAVLGPPVLIAHSHGGQVALLAIRLGLPVHGLITVCTPVRRDVLRECEGRTPQRWVHVYGDHADRWQWLGEVGDGVFGIVRQMPVPGVINVPAARGHGHSGLLTTQSGLRAWLEVLHTYEEAFGAGRSATSH